MNVSVSDLRKNLKHYMDLVEKGEEIRIIRNSSIIGTIQPSAAAKKRAGQAVGKPLQLNKPQTVQFRRYRPADREKVIALHKEALKAAGAYVEPTPDKPWLDLDLEDVEAAYINLGGDFLVGTLEDEIVAMAAFRMALRDSQAGTAELKRMRVKPEHQGKGIGVHLLDLIEERARRAGYNRLVLDATDAQNQAPARRLYESRGYREYRRQPAEGFTLIFYGKDL
jgi:GNAT superfamily N-acetyltransferase